MKIVSNTVWDGLKLPDYRARFFIEVWKEILYVNTPSFYQSKMINTMSGAEELVEAIDDYIQDDKSKKSLLSMIEDYKGNLKKDSIAKDTFKNLHATLLKKIETVPDPISSNYILELKTIVKLVLSKESDYYHELKKQLKSSILSNADLNKKARLMDSIYQLTKSFIGYLLWKGYSPTYLYNRMEYLTRIKNYGSRDFSAQFNSCLDKLTIRIHDYTVYFLITPLSKYLIELNNILDVSFINREGIINEKNYNKISQGVESSVLAKIVVNTTDYVSAAWQANEKLDKVIDYLEIEKPEYNIRYSPVCLTEFSNGRFTHRQTINIGRLKQFITSKNYSILENIPNESKVLLRESIKLDRYDVLTRSLRYLRVAKESTSLEQKLLGVWIALECIFESTSGNIISGITNHIPTFYSTQSLEIRIRYSKDLLEARLKPISDSLLEITANQKSKFRDLSLKEYFDIVKIEKNRNKIFDELVSKGDEFAVFRLIKIFESFGTSKKINDRFNDTKKDVESQLYRIYKVRNKITHRAYYGNIRPQLVDHLYSYLLSAYSTLIYSLRYNAINKFEPQDMFNAYIISCESLIFNVEEEKNLKI
ncbi:hypothetical protein ECDEC15E_5307 [Escherichia coli DEC15E]|nr:HEPN family anti-phage protein ApeA [Escherichia coli]EHY13647.1 hypothetical protein ECDEC15E_5307 [Escherichia coli DEC15E]